MAEINGDYSRILESIRKAQKEESELLKTSLNETLHDQAEIIRDGFAAQNVTLRAVAETLGNLRDALVNAATGKRQVSEELHFKNLELFKEVFKWVVGVLCGVILWLTGIKVLFSDLSKLF